ncbi:MAG: alpha/beta hydrolase [Pseudolabrys sp.]|jgi:fermentation-respiration switch protein FrsA (DUF1100 family)
MTALKWLLLIAIVGYGGVLGLMYVFQRTLMYFPDPTRTPPVAAGLPQAEEVTLTSGDGEKLVTWYVAPKGAKPVIIYFHGNAGALNLRAGRFKWLIEDGTGLLALAYRGYGGSTGKPSETGLISDGIAAYDFVLARFPARNIVLWGESLGTGVAVAVAAEREIGAVILDAPFTSLADVGAAAYPFAPVRWLIKDPFHSDERIARLTAPLLVLHGERDRIVPIALGEKLFSLAREPKRFVRFPLGGHVDLDDNGAQKAVRTFLSALADRASR